MSKLYKQNTVKRILQVTGTMNRGGAETMIMNLYRELDKSKVQFDFISYSEEVGDYDAEIKEMGGKVIYIPSPKEIGFLKYFKKLKEINKKFGPYYGIHSHTLFNSGISLTCARIIGIHTRVCHAHSTSTSGRKDYRYKLYKTMMKFLINMNSTQKIACGNEAGLYLFGRDFKTEGKVLPNAINLDDFNSTKDGEVNRYKEEIGCKVEEIIIGNVGSFRLAKNHEFMIEIAEDMKSKGILFKMIFVGEGPLFDVIKEKVNSKNLEKQIIFTGLRDDIPVLMNVFDLLLMPSLYEGFPVTLVESQASNIADVISDNISGEVDFGLGMIERVSLSDSKEIWVNAIIRGKKLKNKCSNSDIFNRLYEHGYIIKNSTNKLMKIYGIEKK